jgi:hypothetical protein
MPVLAVFQSYRDREGMCIFRKTVT